MKLLSIKPSKVRKKKWTAIFEKKDGRKKTINFGAKGYDDYTIGGTDKQRSAYLARHKKDKINIPDSAGSLSYWILWGKSKDMEKNIKDFRKKFDV
tara:strand:+ start:1759 stop:2046 length:288 start_codon:yes stop_codon:yes gene_type:complete